MGKVIGIFTFLAGVWAAGSQRKHLLSLLLVMEVLPLGLFILLGCGCLLGGFIFAPLYFLAFVACSGALGISLLVRVVRSSGNDFVASLRFSKF